MPLKSRSVRTTSLNNVARGWEGEPLAAKSATPTRALETPSPVPVLNQSCAEAGAVPKSPMEPQMNTDRYRYRRECIFVERSGSRGIMLLLPERYCAVLNMQTSP